MLQPLTLPTPPAVPAPAKTSTIITPEPPPPGSKPSAKGVERIRKLRAELGPYDELLRGLRRTLVTTGERFRESVVSRLADKGSADESVEQLWARYQGQIDSVREVTSVVRDLNEEMERYNAAKQPLLDATERREKLRAELQKALDPEAAKLTAALQEAVERFEKAAFDGFLPFCDDKIEAERLIGETTKVQNIRQVNMAWIGYTHGGKPGERATAFLNAWEQLQICLSAISPE